ncbi:MAG: B12-binding domain-containing radical SAM protein [Candidatus Omnitrophica bacterium]|nr:B12-binding domain-containing radical SAM protein [Candidatus Omnitrophota bacterium]
MKILLTYPPLSSQKGIPLLSQNRQFQFFKEPTYIYPVVPATAATLLKVAGHQVIWLDGIAQNLNYDKFLEIVDKEAPDLIAFETKTPVIKQHWKIIDDIKARFPQGKGPDVVLFGDHVTALPEESFYNSKVDFVLTGGDYDFLLLNLCNALKSEAGSRKSEVTGLEPGIYYREDGHIQNTGKFQLNHDLNSLPPIDRDLTQWKLYAFKNGNYKRTPGTYIMSGRDCWWGKCTFCSWPTLYPEFRSRSVENVLNEIGLLVEKHCVREIMDDSGSFPAGAWLENFCNGIIQRGYHKKVYLDCNMRFGALSYEDFALMKKANFRLLLFGLESASQKTLDRINKNLKVDRIIEDCKAAARAGLFPHITIMFGYPWESYEDALETLKLGSWLLKKGYAYTMQATMVVPYPGTPLFEECKREGWLRTLNWEDYDMKQPVMQTGIPDDKIMELVQGMYKVSFEPEFILRKLFSVRDIYDLKYSFRAAEKVLGHILDFSKNK